MKNGFTLVEIVVVLMLLAIATAVVTPALGKPPKPQEPRATAEVYARLLERARGGQEESRTGRDERLVLARASVLAPVLT